MAEEIDFKEPPPLGKRQRFYGRIDSDFCIVFKASTSAGSPGSYLCLNLLAHALDRARRRVSSHAKVDKNLLAMVASGIIDKTLTVTNKISTLITAIGLRVERTWPLARKIAIRDLIRTVRQRVARIPRIRMRRSYLRSFARQAVRMMMLIVLPALLFQAAARSFAQSSSSGVNGLVTDPSGVAVPEAEVTLRSVDMNVDRENVSSGIRQLLLQRGPASAVYAYRLRCDIQDVDDF